MNRELINKVMASIETEERAAFDMRDVIRDDDEHPCGTAGCIFGHYLIVKYDIKDLDDWMVRRNIPTAVNTVVQEDFGLDLDGLSELFFANRSESIGLSNITKSMAHDALIDVKEGRFESWQEYA